MPSRRRLPDFIPPMLALAGEPFDSDDYLFEIKWNGTRALAFIDEGGYRLVNRRRAAMNDRYPEFAFLAELPAGTVLDGEIVVLRHGKPDFDLLLSREQSRMPLRIRALAHSLPATFIAFDQLYAGYRSLMSQPLAKRRKRLAQTVRQAANDHLVVSDGVVGAGQAFFREVTAQGLEGVVAKRLRSRYQPGKRNEAWIKIKRVHRLFCAIVGFLPEGKNDFRSLVLAADDGDGLRLVGKVGTGFDAAVRKQVNRALWGRLSDRPMIPCRLRAKWVSPGLYCWTSYLERTKSGELRAPVFMELHEDQAD